MTKASSNNPSIPVRDGEALDWAALDRCLKRKLEDLSGEPRTSQYPNGNSNLTYRLEYPDRDLVVRRPPFGTKAKSAHSMMREFRVMSALKPLYPAVPTTLFHSDDETVIGSEFYVMERVEGELVGIAIPQHWGFDQSDTRRFCVAFWDKLIELHQVDFEAAGLADFGRPQGYISRQIEGWNDRYQRSRTADVDEFADVQQWLAESQPETETRASIIHGDFRIDNVMVDPRDHFRIVALLDWEISALGDPLMDLGNALAYWVQEDDPEFLRALKMHPSDAPGMLRREEILALYQDRTGLDTDNFDFYRVYGYFRNAVILQQIYYRFFHGQTQDRRFAMFGQITQALGAHCRALIETARVSE